MKKVLLLVLSAVLVMQVFTGCGEVKKVNKNSSGETATLIWYLPTSIQPDAEVMVAEFNKKLKEKANIQVKFNFIEFGAYEERMNMAISANEKFDLCYTSGSWINKYFINVAKGAFLPLNKLIDENAPELKTIMPKYLYENITVKNDVYAIPNYQISYNVYGLYLQKSLVDKYNFDVSKVPQAKRVDTLKALEPFFENIVKNEKNIIPYRKNYGFYGDFVGSDGVDYAALPSIPIRVKTGDKLTAMLIDDVPGYSVCDDLYRDWYKKGYIRKDHSSVLNDSQDITNLKYAAMPMNSKPGNLEGLEATYKTKFVEIQLEPEIVDCSSGTGAMTAISTKSTNPKAAMELLKLVNTDKELYNILCFGVEGVHYTKLDENTAKPVEGSKYSPKTDFAFGNQFNAILVQGQRKDVWEVTKKINETAKQSKLVGFIFDNEAVKSQISQLASIDKEFKDIWAFDDYEKLKVARRQKRIDAGVEKVIEEVQKQLDAWKK
jgi:putative aldouronate transport system substrate-binding protein